ncbi:MAG: threonylcarbamoyl-AMP synthase [Rhodospirillales bacterium]|nr:threonylcarbamoyl-AMP synthase [Rhodospirillales bacterium]
MSEAARQLRAGGLVAFPTETVYGLGADARDDAAVGAIFAAKGRPSFNPLIVHFPDASRAAEEVEFGRHAELLATHFWPGALTLVLPRRRTSGISLLCSAGLDTLAVRVPSQPIARKLLEAAAIPIAAPSANRASAISPTMADHVITELAGRIDLVVDGGTCRVGVESTVVDLSTDKAALLRPGGIPAEDIEAVIGPLAKAGDGAPKSPGMLRRHYAPGRPVRLDAEKPTPGEALLGFGDVEGATLNLSPSGDLAEAAANFFAMMRQLDAGDHIGIAVSSIPDTGLGRAINDRLRRAATPADQDAHAIAGKMT